MKLLALKVLLMTEPDVNQTPQTEAPPPSIVTDQEALILSFQEAARLCLEKVEEDLRLSFKEYVRSPRPRLPERRRTIKVTESRLNVDGTAEPEIIFHFAGHGKSIAAVLPDAAIEADEAEFEQLEADFSELLAQLDASAVESSHRQAVIAELRQTADAELAALAEVVAAL